MVLYKIKSRRHLQTQLLGWSTCLAGGTRLSFQPARQLCYWETWP